MNRTNIIIYFIVGTLSLVFLGLYFIDYNNALCIASCSIGASGIGAVLLGFLIERSNLAYSNKKLLSDRETVLYPILLWLDNAVCGFISYLDQIGNEFEVETVKEFFGVFEELRRKEVLDEYSFIKQIDESDYLHEVKGWFMESPLAISAIKDISFNRSYVLRNNLFSDNEVRNLNLICVLISNVQCSESAREIHAKLLNIFLYMNLPEIHNIQIKKDAAGLTFFHDNRKIFVVKN